ncbi:protease modulator HflC [Rickettsiales bacterium]|nr:protease modulator HflC [Rickettsiales bacterium]
MINSKFIIILAIAGIFLLLNSVFIVKQTEQAIVLEFGKPVQFKDGDKVVSYINSPGLKFKVPFIQDVVFFDNRVLNFRAADKEILDVEQKTLTVNAFAKYKITDPLKFYETVTDERGIDRGLDKIFEASLRDNIGSIPLKKLLTEVRKDVMVSLKEDVRKKAESFGIKVFDVRIVRADLPKENSDAIFKRMYSDRDKEARESRAQGKEEAKIIVATAQKESTVIRANASRDSNIIRGDGEAKATKIFADAFNRDPDFYSFYRSMQAYKQTMKDSEKTRVILSPDSDFMRYFGSITGSK